MSEHNIPIGDGSVPDRWKDGIKALSALQLSEQGERLIKHYEHCRLRAYQDSKGIWTIGWGCTFYEDRSRVKKGDTITQARADRLFKSLVKDFEDEVKELLKVRVTQNQFDALMSFAFNVGTDIDIDTIAEGLGDSTLLKKVNTKAPDKEIIAEFMKWVYSGGKKLGGLVKRRASESHLYAYGVLILE